MAAEVRPAPIAPELFTLLESSELHVVEDTKKVIHENLSSNRESWLVNSLVDYYYLSHSRQVLEILKEIREPHDKHLLEKLNEGIKSEQHQLYALQFLLQVVVEHPPWCRRLTNTSVFRALIKCLRTETDIPVLMTAVTIITIVLPSLPTVIAPFLQDIFEIFHRLVAFCVKKPGNVPDVYLLHLRVSVYSLFHRLYGMYPYNFLTYLRQCYNKKENLTVFEEVVKSMLERVRLHPNLITGTKESEIAPQRWRAMETHDVLVECAKLSLDLIEGTWEELHCPFTSLRYNSQIPMSSNEAGAAIVTTPPGIGSSLDNSSAASEPLKLLQSPFTPLSMRIDNSGLWSPSEIVGLSTPPPSQMTTPSSVTDTSNSSLPQLQGLPVLTPGHSTFNTPRESSPIIDESEKIMSQIASRGSLRGKGSDPQQRNLDLNFSSSQASSTFTQLFPGDPHGMFSTPQSPLKKEFTSTPPVGIIKTKPVLQAAREINFNKPPGIFNERRQSLEGVQKTQGSLEAAINAESLHSSAIKGDSKETKESACQQEGNRAFEDSSEHGKPDHNGSDQMKLTSSEQASNSYKNGTLSVDTLTHVIEDFEHPQEDCEDDEVSELTKFEGPAGASGSQHMITAESVAKFMKKINRIRFNSLTATNNISSLVTQGKGNLCKRSRSCPHLRKISFTEEEDEDDDDDNELSHSLSTMNFPPSSSVTFDSKKEKVVLTEGVQVVLDSKSNNQTDAGIATASTTTAVVKTETLMSTVEPELSMKTMDSKVVNNPNDTVYFTAQSTSVMTTDEDYLKLLKQLLTPLSVTGVEVPLFSTFSPSELLDRHLLLGSEIHDKELSKMSITSSCTVNWTHFGGVPPADEVNILRGQILLMHNQLMYERHKRDQHAKRNRRLLRKITHAKAVEEQNATLRDQMRMHENTIRDLRVSLKLLHSDNRRLKDNIDSDEYQRQLQLKNCLQENQSLKAQKEELNTLLVQQREEEESLRKKLQIAESQLFNTEKELEHMKEQAALNLKLKEQVFQLHKELLLMGELQQKCQEKLQRMKPSIRSKQEHESLINSLKAETKVLKTKLESRSVNLKVCKARISELEEEIKNKDNSLLELKRKLEMAKSGHNEEIQCVEEKHQCLMRINQQLGSQILNLYSEIENLRTAKRKYGPGDHQKHSEEGRQSSTEQISFDSSSDQTMREPLARITSPSERLSGAAANSITGDSLGSSESQGHFGGFQRDGGSQLVGSLELPGIMNPPFLERQTGAESSSLSSSSLSRYSNIGPSIRQPGLFDTDSEDNQSVLSGNTVTGSGYNG
ncbi:hypothetical protein ACJMK2_039542 [Sinanodonta woodiana]|uniref:Hamartin n=1 Tax=Sinanodonta woodiana TaxID=1069815 RepID=A0ABD3WCB5_SINWO